MVVELALKLHQTISISRIVRYNGYANLPNRSLRPRKWGGEIWWPFFCQKLTPFFKGFNNVQIFVLKTKKKSIIRKDVP